MGWWAIDERSAERSPRLAVRSQPPAAAEHAAGIDGPPAPTQPRTLLGQLCNDRTPHGQ
ncbi:MAG: hypothetical protein WD425_01465 [Nitrospirales bacterium]